MQSVVPVRGNQRSKRKPRNALSLRGFFFCRSGRAGEIPGMSPALIAAALTVPAR